MQRLPYNNTTTTTTTTTTDDNNNNNNHNNNNRGFRIKHKESAVIIRIFKDLLGHRKCTCRDQLCISVCYLFLCFLLSCFLCVFVL